MIHTYLLIVHLPLFKVHLPANVFYFYSILISSFRFDIIPEKYKQ